MVDCLLAPGVAWARNERPNKWPKQKGQWTVFVNIKKWIIWIWNELKISILFMDVLLPRTLFTFFQSVSRGDTNLRALAVYGLQWLALARLWCWLHVQQTSSVTGQLWHLCVAKCCEHQQKMDEDGGGLFAVWCVWAAFGDQGSILLEHRHRKWQGPVPVFRQHCHTVAPYFIYMHISLSLCVCLPVESYNIHIIHLYTTLYDLDIHRDSACPGALAQQGDRKHHPEYPEHIGRPLLQLGYWAKLERQKECRTTYHNSSTDCLVDLWWSIWNMLTMCDDLSFCHILPSWWISFFLHLVGATRTC